MSHRNHWKLIPAFLGLVIAVLFHAFAEQPAVVAQPAIMKIGVARIDITPDGPIRLGGYHSRSEEAETINQRLFAKALAIEAPDGSLRVLITADMFGISEEISRELARRLEKQAGLERAQLAVTVTHSHTAPWLANVARYMFNGPIPADQQQRVDHYTREIINKLESVSLAAIEERRDSTLAWGKGSAGFAVNRRQIVDGKWAGWGAIPNLHVDHDLPVLAVKDLDGSIRALFMNYACHCVTLTGSQNFVHGDWAGVAAELVEKSHEGAIAMIAIGCGADSNPEPRGLPEHLPDQGKAIAEGVARALAAGLRPIAQAPEVEFRRIDLPLESITREELAKVVESDARNYSAAEFIKQLDRGEPLPTEVSYPIQVWRFGNELAMVFLAGEVVADYSLRLKGELDASRIWVNAYSNAVPGYIVSRRILNEGGYEADQSRRFYHLPSRYQPAVEQIIMETVRDMIPGTFDRNWDNARPAELKGDNKPRTVSPGDDGIIHLIAEAGKPYGPRIEYMPEPGWRAFGWWTDQDYVAWDFEVTRTGEYALYKTWSVADEFADRQYLVEVAGQRIRGYAKRTGTWENFQTREVGRITLPAGTHRLNLKPAAAFGTGGLMDLRELRLVPTN